MNRNYLYNEYYSNYSTPAIMPDNDIFEQSKIGFYKGNMEKNTYVPYKKYTYIEPVITSEKERLLFQIQEMCFAAHEANLYLDLYPNDINIINKFKEYNKNANVLTLEYEKKYGPICLSDNEGITNNSWNWIDRPWPWQN